MEVSPIEKNFRHPVVKLSGLFHPMQCIRYMQKRTGVSLFKYIIMMICQFLRRRLFMYRMRMLTF